MTFAKGLGHMTASVDKMLEAKELLNKLKVEFKQDMNYKEVIAYLELVQFNCELCASFCVDVAGYLEEIAGCLLSISQVIDNLIAARNAYRENLVKWN